MKHLPVGRFFRQKHLPARAGWSTLLCEHVAGGSEPELLCLGRCFGRAGRHTLDTYGVCAHILARVFPPCNTTATCPVRNHDCMTMIRRNRPNRKRPVSNGVRKIILASQSPWRKKILSRAGIAFR